MKVFSFISGGFSGKMKGRGEFRLVKNSIFEGGIFMIFQDILIILK